jgi:hypothetical protein
MAEKIARLLAVAPEPFSMQKKVIFQWITKTKSLAQMRFMRHDPGESDIAGSASC